jgi:hypothetical protein
LDENIRLPRIDDPIDASKRFYSDTTVEATLAEWAGGAFLPAWIASAVGMWGAKAKFDRIWSLLRALEQGLRGIQKTHVTKAEVQEGLALIAHRDAEAQNDVKLRRYLSVLIGAVTRAERVDDLVTLIQDIERLGEEDIRVLGVLYEMYLNGPAIPTNSLHAALDPNQYVNLSETLMKRGPKDPSETDDLYAHCSRLAGFGLALEVTVPRTLTSRPVGSFFFRISNKGRELMSLLPAPDNSVRPPK